MLKDTFQKIVSLLDKGGYQVKTFPDEMLRPNEVYIDVEDINLSEIFTGGNTVDVIVSVTLIRKDRSKMLDDIENLIKLLDLPNLKFDRCICEHDGEAVIVTLMFAYTEVIYSV